MGKTKTPPCYLSLPLLKITYSQSFFVIALNIWNVGLLHCISHFFSLQFDIRISFKNIVPRFILCIFCRVVLSFHLSYIHNFTHLLIFIPNHSWHFSHIFSHIDSTTYYHSSQFYLIHLCIYHIMHMLCFMTMQFIILHGPWFMLHWCILASHDMSFIHYLSQVYLIHHIFIIWCSHTFFTYATTLCCWQTFHFHYIINSSLSPIVVNT